MTVFAICFRLTQFGRESFALLKKGDKNFKGSEVKNMNNQTIHLRWSSQMSDSTDSNM